MYNSSIKGAVCKEFFLQNFGLSDKAYYFWGTLFAHVNAAVAPP